MGCYTVHVFAADISMLIDAASCPLVEDLYLQDADDMLQLLVAPSQRRTHILAWICTRDVLHLCTSLVKLLSVDSFVDDHTEMAMLGKELMLCNADDFDLIKVSVHQ
uniref:Uncharacterized protein n=1 Tax=Gouania willdenowi TaxID=441366 RepID=A0A8C5DTC4_GOUWI